MGKFLDIDELMFADENTLECIWINDFNFENLSIDDEGCDTIMVYYNNKFIGHMERFSIYLSKSYCDAICINNKYFPISKIRDAWA